MSLDVGLRRLRPLVPVAVIAGFVAILPFRTCLVRIVLGVPCPGCGVTRALLALAHLDVAEALRFQPLLPLLALLAAVTVGAAFVLEDRPFRRLTAWTTGIGGVGLILVWALRFCGFFGGPVLDGASPPHPRVHLGVQETPRRAC